MKPGIHPTYQRATVQCACGNNFVTRSTTSVIHVEICAKCHPYFTGKLRLVDTAGRIERFRAKYRSPAEVAAEAKAADENREAAEAKADHDSRVNADS